MVEGTTTSAAAPPNPYDEQQQQNGSAEQQQQQPAEQEMMQNMSAPSKTAPSQQQQFALAKSFEDLNLSEEILKGVYSQGFEQPSQVQQHAILPHIAGQDVLVQSQSGTGKTLAFVIGAVMSVNPDLHRPQVLVLCHTRELCLQTGSVFEKVIQYSKIKHYELYGGRYQVGADSQLAESHIIVGTTGKIKNFIQRGRLHTATIKQLVVDEADKMLEGDFIEDVGEICNLLENKANLQVCFYSATIPESTIGSVKTIMRPNYYEFLLEKSDVTLDGIKQYYFLCESDDFKLQVLNSLLGDFEVNTIVLFANFKEKVAQLANFCDQLQIPYVSIMGSMEQEERVQNMQLFRSAKKRFLIATDLVGRGMDVQHVSLVINFQMPLNREDYIHRIGRSGRYGKKGIAINLVTQEEYRTLKSFEDHYHFKCAPLPQDISSIQE